MIFRRFYTLQVDLTIFFLLFGEVSGVMNFLLKKSFSDNMIDKSFRMLEVDKKSFAFAPFARKSRI